MIPLPYRLAAVAALIGALFGAGYWMGFKHERAAWAADVVKREKAEASAIIERTAENVKLAAQQASDNAAITKAHDEELASVRARLAASERMRRPAFCGGTPAPAQAESAASSTPADPPSGLLPVEVDRDIKALVLQTEEIAATARACQAFIHDNGMEP